MSSSALGRATNEIALKVATEALGWCQRVGTIEDSHVRTTDRINTPSPEQTLRSPLSRRLIMFALPRAEALGYGV